MPDEVMWAGSVDEAFDIAMEPHLGLSGWHAIESVRPMVYSAPLTEMPRSVRKTSRLDDDPVLLADLERAPRMCSVGTTTVEAHWNAGRLTQHTSNGRPGGKRLVDPLELEAVMALAKECDESSIAERLPAELTAE
jgi:hypothetical protein